MERLLSRMSSCRTEAHSSAAHRVFLVGTGEAARTCTKNNNTAKTLFSLTTATRSTMRAGVVRKKQVLRMNQPAEKSFPVQNVCILLHMHCLM